MKMRFTRRLSVLTLAFSLMALFITSAEHSNAAGDSTSNSLDLSNWGTGIALIKNTKSAISNASIVNGTVRASSQSNYEASVLVARHFYPFSTEKNCSKNDTKTACFGMMVGVGLGGSNSGSGSSQVINFLGLGIELGSPTQVAPADKSPDLTSWNFGIGVGRKFGVQVLGDGFANNAAPPSGETQVRYKTIDITAPFIFFTAHW